MIIFGWGKRTVKNFGEFESKYCDHCHNTCNWEYRRYITWFTLFFIPVIPYQFLYIKVCPICGRYEELSKEEFTVVTGEGSGLSRQSNGMNSESSVHNGLTETQRNYRKQMEDFARSRNEN